MSSRSHHGHGQSREAGGDRYGLVTSETVYDADASAQTTQSSYAPKPHLRLPTSSTENPTGLALTTQTTYDSTFNRPATVTLPAGNTWQNTYYGSTETLQTSVCSIPTTVKQSGLLRKRTGPDPAGPDPAGVEEFAYDAAARQAATRIGTGPWTCAAYDARGRVTTQTVPAFASEPARTVTHDYAVGGNPLVNSVADAAGTITTTLDLLGRVISYTDVWAKTTTTNYNQAGRTIRTNGPAGDQQYSYDDSGRLTQHKLDSAIVAVPAYDASGELTSVAYPSGTGNGGNGTALKTLSRDHSGRVKRLEWGPPGGSAFATDEVSRSQSGRVIDQKIDGVDHHAGDDFLYDNAGRLIEAWVPGRHVTYSFASAGGCGTLTSAGQNTNRTAMTIAGSPTVTYCYDEADRLTSTTDSRYTSIAYDVRGNTTTLGDESMTYDGADRHVATTKAGSVSVRYTRDATDRIVERNVLGVGLQRYGFSGDGDSPDFTMNLAGGVTDRMIPLPGGAFITKRAVGEVWSYPNIHGDVMATADSSGAKQGPTRTYDPYGEALSGIPDNSDGNLDYGWLGQHMRPIEHEGAPLLAEIATIEMGARAYVPGLGRFLEVDPVEGGSANDYEYASGDPINQFDVDGTFCILGHNPDGGCRGARAARAVGSFVWRNKWDILLAASAFVPGLGVASAFVRGYRIVVGLHRAHHTFRWVGRVRHVSVTIYKAGRKRWNIRGQLPIPFWRGRP